MDRRPNPEPWTLPQPSLPLCSDGSRFAPASISVTQAYALSRRLKPPRRFRAAPELLASLRRYGTSRDATDAPHPSLVDATAAEHGVNTVDRHGQAALGLAAHQGLKATVRALLLHGALVDRTDLEGETALMRSARRGHVDCVRLLCDADADVNVASHKGMSALMHASAAGHLECVKLLCARGADTSRRERYSVEQSDALWLACDGGHLRVCQVLASYGALTHEWAGRIRRRCGGAARADRPLAAAVDGWLRRTAHLTTALHFVEWMEPARALALLRGGADVHARAAALGAAALGAAALGAAAAAAADAARPGAILHDSESFAQPPTPLEIAHRRLCARSERQSTEPADADASDAAARLVVEASQPWSPHTARLFPDGSRRLARALLWTGHELAHRYASRSSHALIEVWIAMVMPLVVARDCECGSAPHGQSHGRRSGTGTGSGALAAAPPPATDVPTVGPSDWQQDWLALCDSAPLVIYFG